MRVVQRFLFLFFVIASIRFDVLDSRASSVLLGSGETRIPERSFEAWTKEYEEWRKKNDVRLVLAELHASMKRETAMKKRRNGKLIRHLFNSSPEIAIMIFAGRVIADRRFLGKEKNRKHALFLTSILEKKIISPDLTVAYAYSGNSTGFCMNDGVPCAVIAKRFGYSNEGFLIPNPYFHDPDFWEAVRISIIQAATTRPFEERDSRVFWRGHVTNSYISNLSQSFASEPCEDEHGNFARLQALALSIQHPEYVDVKCWQLQKCLNIRDDSVQQCPGLEYDKTMTAIRKEPELATHEGHVVKENFSKYKFLLNLPGSTQGSYSRNLNHLWALGSVILFWKNTHKEWYYPALKHMSTHLDVDYTSLIPILNSLSPSTIKNLRDGAYRIDQTFLCPICLAFYMRAVYDELVQQFYSTRELDNPCTARHFFRTLNCSNLDLVLFLHNTRALSKFDLAHTPHATSGNDLQHKTKDIHRRLSTLAPVALGNPGSCAGLVELASQACARKNNKNIPLQMLLLEEFCDF